MPDIAHVYLPHRRRDHAVINAKAVPWFMQQATLYVLQNFNDVSNAFMFANTEYVVEAIALIFTELERPMCRGTSPMHRSSWSRPTVSPVSSLASALSRALLPCVVLVSKPWMPQSAASSIGSSSDAVLRRAFFAF